VWWNTFQHLVRRARGRFKSLVVDRTSGKNLRNLAVHFANMHHFHTTQYMHLKQAEAITIELLNANAETVSVAVNYPSLNALCLTSSVDDVTD
jgi:hypothetical protein